MEEDVRQGFAEIKAILQTVAERQAAAEARAGRAEERMDRFEARFEKRMRGFEKLVQIGMREIAELRRLERKSDEKMNALDGKMNTLIDSHQRTEATLQAFIASLRTGGNGRAR